MKPRSKCEDNRNDETFACQECPSDSATVTCTSDTALTGTQNKQKRSPLVASILSITLPIASSITLIWGVIGTLITYALSVIIRFGIYLSMLVENVDSWATCLAIVLISPNIDIMASIINILLPFFFSFILIITALSMSIYALAQKRKLGIVGLILTLLVIILISILALLIITASIFFVVYFFIPFSQVSETPNEVASLFNFVHL